MNILHVVNIYFVIPYFLGDQLSYFKDKGHNIFIISSPSELLIPLAKKQGFKYLELPILRKISIKNDLKVIINVCKYIKENQIEIVFGHTPKGAFIAMIAASLMRISKRIYFRHGLVYETSKGIKHFILKLNEIITAFFSTIIVCVSPSVYYKSIKDKLNPKKKQIILSKGTCNGIDAIGKFNPDNIREIVKNSLKEKYKIKNNSIVIGYTGRLVRDKGIVELYETFNILKMEKKLNIILLLVGMFEERDSLPKELIYKIKEDKSVILTGYVNEDIQYYYSIMDIFILPSYREGFPTSVLEASSMLLPVITTKVTGCIDSIIENFTGIFVDNNVMSIEKGISFYINNIEIRKEHGKNGRDFVVSNFEQKVIWNEIDKII